MRYTPTIIDRCQLRRQQLLDHMPNRSAVLILAPQMSRRNGDVYHPFRQHSHLLYLTAFDEPESMMILIKAENKGHFHLFCRDHCAQRMIWDGPCIGHDQALSYYRADSVDDINNLERCLPTLLQDIDIFMYDKQDHQLVQHLRKACRRLGESGRHRLTNKRVKHEDLALLNEMRLIKDDIEIACLTSACQVSARAHEYVQSITKPGMNEYQIEAQFRFYCHDQGHGHMAYPPIVAGANRANILHYTANNQALTSGDLLLIDAGCECQGYAADITRTLPVNGQMTAEQQAVYDIVSDAQNQVIEMIKPQIPYHALQQKAVEVITQGLVDLGLLKGQVQTLIASKAYLNFYMHNIGHWLGLDVHDVGSYHETNHQSRRLQPGMVLTVEPGIYIREDDAKHKKQFAGIGIRIEDDIMVTSSGYNRLSAISA